MGKPFNNDQASRYSALAARCNYLAPDCPDIAFSVKELARHMSCPTMGELAQTEEIGEAL